MPLWMAVECVEEVLRPSSPQRARAAFLSRGPCPFTPCHLGSLTFVACGLAVRQPSGRIQAWEWIEGQVLRHQRPAVSTIIPAQLTIEDNAKERSVRALSNAGALNRRSTGATFSPAAGEPGCP